MLAQCSDWPFIMTHRDDRALRHAAHQRAHPALQPPLRRARRAGEPERGVARRRRGAGQHLPERRLPHLRDAERGTAGVRSRIPRAASPLKVLFVASECAPFAKTGGLADVVGRAAQGAAPPRASTCAS